MLLKFLDNNTRLSKNMDTELEIEILPLSVVNFPRNIWDTEFVAIHLN